MHLFKSIQKLYATYSKNIKVNIVVECLPLKGCFKNVRNEITN